MPRKSLKTEQENETELLHGRLKPERFWEATKRYQPRDGVTYRLYRLWPQIDRALTGHQDNAIDIQPEMDEDYILQHHGSGDYQVFFHDANRPRGQSEICYTILELRHPNFPPVVDPAELVWGAEKNRGYIEGLKARGILPPGAPQEREQKSDSAAASVVAEALGFARDAMRKPAEAPGAKEAIQLVTEGYRTLMQQQLDPLGTLVKAKELLGQPGADLRPVIEMWGRLMERQTEILIKLMERQQPQQNGIQQINELLDLAERLKPAAGSGLRSWLPQTIAAAVSLLQTLIALRQAPQPAAALAPPAQNPPEANMTMPQIPGIDPRMLELARKAVAAFEAGVSGDAFAEAVERNYGSAMLDQIAALGREAIVTALRSVPQVAQAVTDWAAVEKFVADFIAYAQAEDEATVQ